MKRILLVLLVFPGIAFADRVGDVANDGPKAPPAQIPPVVESPIKGNSDGELIGPTQNENKVFSLRKDNQERGEIRLTVQNWGEPAGSPIYVKLEARCAGKQSFIRIDNMNTCSFEGLSYNSDRDEVVIAFKKSKVLGGRIACLKTPDKRAYKLDCK